MKVKTIATIVHIPQNQKLQQQLETIMMEKVDGVGISGQTGYELPEMMRADRNANDLLDDGKTKTKSSLLNGGLNLIATLLGLPGKMDIAGHMVQNLYDPSKVKDGKFGEMMQVE